MGKEDEIKIIAYSIWEEENCPEGRDVEHWLRAEVIWQEKQRNTFVSTDTSAKSEQAVKQVKRGQLNKRH